MSIVAFPLSVMALVIHVSNFDTPSMLEISRDLEVFQKLHSGSYEILLGNNREKLYIFPSPDLPREIQLELIPILQLEFELIPHQEQKIKLSEIR